MATTYVTKDAVMQAIGAVFEPVQDVEQALLLNCILKAINQLPGADVEAVVRCKDCKKLQKCEVAPKLGLDGHCSDGKGEF